MASLLLPYLMLTEEERTPRMINLLRLDITQVIKINEDLPVTMEDFFGRALCINRRMDLIKENESQEDKAKGKEVKQGKKKKRNYFTSKKAIPRNNNKRDGLPNLVPTNYRWTMDKPPSFSRKMDPTLKVGPEGRWVLA